MTAPLGKKSRLGYFVWRNWTPKTIPISRTASNIMTVDLYYFIKNQNKLFWYFLGKIKLAEQERSYWIFIIYNFKTIILIKQCSLVWGNNKTKEKFGLKNHKSTSKCLTIKFWWTNNTRKTKAERKISINLLNFMFLLLLSINPLSLLKTTTSDKAK